MRTPLFGMLAPDAPFFATFRVGHAPRAPGHDAPRTWPGRGCCPTTAGRSTTTSPRWASTPSARCSPATRSSSTRPSRRSSWPRCSAWPSPHARTVGVHMASWEVDARQPRRDARRARAGRDRIRSPRRWAHAWSPRTACASCADEARGRRARPARSRPRRARGLPRRQARAALRSRAARRLVRRSARSSRRWPRGSRPTSRSRRRSSTSMRWRPSSRARRSWPSPAVPRSRIRTGSWRSPARRR